ncbi:MAG: glycosyl hydrolase-related protein [Candidatus Sumerlaeota bacterium]|nr:glycosyl hydrolase-related protein [Candidatus Sumerlaeota bacterium]
MFDKRLRAEMLEPGKAGNLLRFYHDARDQAEAWVIGELREFQPEIQIEASIVETGPLRACLRFTRRTRLCDDLPPTILVQDISLRAGSPILRFETHGDWQAREAMLKAEFSLSFPCEAVVAEAPYGVVERSTIRPETTGALGADSAPEDGQARRTPPPKPDRPMQKWLDFSDGKKGVAFLNNGRYGYDAHARVLRLSLLRAPFMRKELDEVLGLGPFSFAYAVMPHAGDWREADLPKRGYEFNYDLLAVRHDRPDLVDRRIYERVYTGPRREPRAFVAAGGSSALLTAVKRAEDEDALVLRLVETLGREATARIAFDQAIQGAVECDLLERPADRGPCAVQRSGRLTIDGAGLTVSLQPFEIKTIRVLLSRN